MNSLYRYKFLTAAFIITLLVVGCFSQPIRIGFLDPSMDTIDFTKGRPISASASGFQLLLFIPISLNDRQARAYAELQSEAGTDYITDVKIEESWTYAFVGTVYKTTMKAMAYPRIASTTPVSKPTPTPVTAPAVEPSSAPGIAK